MNKNTYSRVVRVENTNDFGVRNRTKLEEDPLGWAHFEAIQQSNARIQDIVKRISGNGSGKPITGHKLQARVLVEKDNTRISGLLVSFGYANTVPEFMDLKHGTPWVFKRMTEVELAANTTHLKQVMAENPESTTAAGVTEEMRTQLDTHQALFEEWRKQPRQFKKSTRAVRTELEKELAEAESFRDRVVLPYMRGRYAESDPLFFQEFLTSLEVDKPGHTLLLLEGQITQKETGAPLKDVRISIDGARPVRHGGDKGYYRMKRITPGLHTLTFSRKGFQDLVREVVVVAGETLRLNIEMEKVKTTEPS